MGDAFDLEGLPTAAVERRRSVAGAPRAPQRPRRQLYAEVILYEGMGDPVRAVERINKILTNAPLSPAAGKFRDRAVLTETAKAR